MYAGDANGRISTNVNSGNHLSATPQLAGEEGVPDSGPAVEVIELANGETIWSVVDDHTLLSCLINGCLLGLSLMVCAMMTASLSMTTALALHRSTPPTVSKSSLRNTVGRRRRAVTRLSSHGRSKHSRRLLIDLKQR